MFKYIEFCDVFDLGEKREKLQILKEGIVIEIRNKEDGHNVPHIHAHYQGENISISLIDGEVLAGNIPKKNQKIAVTWVIENLEMLRASWENKHGLIKFPDMIIKYRVIGKMEKSLVVSLSILLPILLLPGSNNMLKSALICHNL